MKKLVENTTKTKLAGCMDTVEKMNPAFVKKVTFPTSLKTQKQNNKQTTKLNCQQGSPLIPLDYS